VKVSIIGQGYVGLTISVFAAEHHSVVGFDKNQGVVDALNLGKSHIEGVESADLARHIANGRFTATTDANEIVGSDVVVIAVPTPLTKDRKPDLVFVEAACKTIGENLKTPALIINESTSFPGTVRNLIKPLVEKYSGGSLEHLYAVSPERVDPGRIDWNQKNTPRLYAGLTPKASEGVRDFYATFCDNLVEVSSPEVAESAKLFENTFRQVNIALVNEFAQIAHALGISVYEILDAAATKPYGFMKFMPSAGVGGHCIPVDPSYLADTAARVGVPATFIERANEVNLEMAKYVVDRVAADNGGSLKDKSVQVVGVAYKPNVADVRETPAELVIEELKAAGASVSWNDDLVTSWMGEKSTALGGSDIALVVTLHAITDPAKVLKSAPYVFDTTGMVKGAHSL
jgi:UDP-N-acetyl-D-glucosamine dehydrogenase